MILVPSTSNFVSVATTRPAMSRIHHEWRRRRFASGNHHQAACVWNQRGFSTKRWLSQPQRQRGATPWPRHLPELHNSDEKAHMQPGPKVKVGEECGGITTRDILLQVLRRHGPLGPDEVLDHARAIVADLQEKGVVPVPSKPNAMLVRSKSHVKKVLKHMRMEGMVKTISRGYRNKLGDWCAHYTMTEEVAAGAASPHHGGEEWHNIVTASSQSPTPTTTSAKASVNEEGMSMEMNYLDSTTQDEPSSLQSSAGGVAAAAAIKEDNNLRDWLCAFCGEPNFGGRHLCFACGRSKWSSLSQRPPTKTQSTSAVGQNGCRLRRGARDEKLSNGEEETFEPQGRPEKEALPRVDEGFKGETHIDDADVTSVRRHNGAISDRWVCSQCNVENPEDRDQCGLCGTPKGGFDAEEVRAPPSSWECPACGHSNSAEAYRCMGCNEVLSPRNKKVGDKQKQGTMLAAMGDWDCRACGMKGNYARRLHCFSCGERREFPNKFDVLKMMKIGDWICSSCQALNFRYRRTCYECGKEGPPKSKPRLKHGDWICPACDQHNFARRVVCIACGTKVNQNRRKGWKEGDWECRNCHNHNYAHRSDCKLCGSPRIIDP